MSRGRLAPWVALALVGTWGAAFQGWSALRLAGWTPDLLLVVLFAVAPRLDRSGLAGAALVVALARSAVSVDPPVALAAGYLGAAGAYGALRATVALEGLGSRAVLAGLLAALLGTWLATVHGVRTGASLLEGAHSLWPPAIATWLATWLAAPLLIRLPLLRHLESRRR